MNITFEEYPVDSKHLDSFWFYDKVIAIVRDNGLAAHIEAHGCIGVYFHPDDRIHNDEDAVKTAREMHLDDDDLDKLSDHDGWSNNNWFDIVVEDESTGETEEIDSVCYRYDEAINSAINTLLERNHVRK